MSGPKLKKCPFCGSPARYVERKSYKVRHGVGCSNEDCIIYLPKDAYKSELHNYVWVFRDLSEMTRKWNRRAFPTEINGDASCPLKPQRIGETFRHC
jgi:hypothetical protein